MGPLSNPAESRPHDDAGSNGEQPSGGRTRLHAWRESLHHRRESIRERPTLNTTYRIALGAFGAVVLLAGIAMIPYPGPGWLVVFAGLGILATEFHWAHRVNQFAKRHYHRWVAWLGRQHIATKLAVMGATGLIVLTTLWLLGLFGTLGGWLGLRWSWLSSPLFGP
ncbi:TIGR02611 family protein [Saccharopolyspora taberi]|uniref:TIGR02611 family protein n=1 Tax=Saccharopolyspora taberi TaxID=60895 RepID=A0ABN3VFY9_9PSEU